MSQQEAIKLFDSKRIRTVWDEEQEKWFFSIVDVVAVLTDSVNPTDYLKKMRKREPELEKGWGQIVTPPLHTKLPEESKKLILLINKQCAAEGGNVARVARQELESKTGREVVSPLSAKRFFEGQDPKLGLEEK